jgi:hypothetical protein
MSTTSFILGINISINIFPSHPTPPPANYTPGSLTDPYLGTNCTNIITPSCLKELYNATDYEPTQMDKNSIAVTGYLNEFANEEDLQTLYAVLLPEAEDYEFQTVTVNGVCTQRWAFCLYMLRIRPDACHLWCQAGKITRI